MAKRGPKPDPERGAKSAVFSTRITQDLRKALEEDTRRHSRSLSWVIQDRLERSFRDDSRRDAVEQAFCGAESYAAFRVLAMVLRSVEFTTGRRWLDDPYTFDLAQRAFGIALEVLRPPGKAERPGDLNTSLADEVLPEAITLGVLGQVAMASAKPLLPGRGIRFSDLLLDASLIKEGLGSVAERLENVR